MQKNAEKIRRIARNIEGAGFPFLANLIRTAVEPVRAFRLAADILERDKRYGLAKELRAMAVSK